MDRLIIYSKKHGKKIVLFDEEDFELVKSFTWTLSCIDGCYYAVAWMYEKNNKPKFIKMHRLILNFPDYNIDHIDRDGLNNRKSNLRPYARGQNKMNSSIPKNNTSGFKGVTFDKNKSLWIVHIGVSGITKKGGRFKNKYAAALRYNELAKKHFGEYANLNVLTDEEIKMATEKEGRRLSSRNSTGYRGVFNYKDVFVAKVSHEKRLIHLGYFKEAKEAAIAYNEAIIKYNLPKEKMNKI
jgi:hypothetical protein